MKSSRMLIYYSLITSGIIVGIVGTILVTSIVRATGGDIYSCVSNYTGVPHIVMSASCGSGETLLTWNSGDSAGRLLDNDLSNLGKINSWTNRDFSGFDFSSSEFEGNANFSKSNVSGADFSSATLSGSTWTDADVSSANFSSAILTGSWMHSNFGGVNFSSANLTGADFAGAAVGGANFTSANLAGANFDGATSMSTATVTGANWDNTTCPDSTNSNDHSNTCVGHF